MARVKAGDVVVNPVTRERMVFRKTPQDTGGELLQFDHWLEAGGLGPPPHLHPKQEERFLCVSGTMGVLRGKDKVTLHPGEEIIVPPNTVHTWWNAGTEELYQITEFRPARRFDAFMVLLAALGRAGKQKTDRVTIPYLLQFALLSGTHTDTVYVAHPPVWMQKLLYPTVLGPLARLLGYKGDYTEEDRLTQPGVTPVLPPTTSRLLEKVR
ncbi:MAG TPA: cupin domain-containing protein [Gemmatimonadaceae bacterium]|nr:cupin domain-containing protein [Gemmatimonadaceae bacterium]